jgi:arsenate reductase
MKTKKRKTKYSQTGGSIMKRKILFVCVHNSARSQMAEALLNSMAPDRFIAESAGLTPGKLNPFAVDAMKEVGLDISNNSVDSVFDFFKAGKAFNFIITVCDAEAAERCPIFPGVEVKRIHWTFPDPSAAEGSDEEKLKAARSARDMIKAKLEEWLKTV